MTINHDIDAHGSDSGPDPEPASDVQWVAFQQARKDLAEVMTDEELAGLGFDLAVLDEVP